MLQSTTETSETPVTLSKASVKLRENQIPIKMINFRHLHMKNIKAFQPFPKIKDYADDLAEISKACRRNSDFVKILTLCWKDKNSNKFPLVPKNLLLFSENLKHLSSSLQTLDLQFRRHGRSLTDECLEQLCQGLKSLYSLEKITMSIGMNKSLRSKGLKSLGKALKRLVLLKEIELDFPVCTGIEDLGVIELSKGIKRCRSLKKLSLKFIHCDQIKIKGINSVGEAVKNLENLESLTLDFSAHGRSGGDLDLKSLSESLKNLRSLKEIKLGLSERHHIRANEFRYLNDVLKGMKLLRKVELNLISWWKTKNQEFMELCEALGEMELLQDLTLNFYSWKYITDEGLCKFGAILGKMSELENLYFNFNYCQKISQIGLDGIKEGVKQLTKIKRVTLETLDANLKHEQRKKFEKDLEGHPSIKEVRVFG